METTRMLEHFGRFFNRNHHCPDGLSRSLDDLQLLDDTVLEDLLDRLEQEPEEERYPLQLSFYEKLMQCDLLMPVPNGSNLRIGLPITALENNHGEKGVPLFTSEKTLGLWIDDASDYVALSFTTFCRYAMEAQADYLVLNVAGPHGCEISFHDFSYLAEGFLPPPREKHGEILVQKDTPIRLASCHTLSASVLDRLQHVFARHTELINSVYLFNVAFNEGPFQPALGIRMPDGFEAHWERELWPNMEAVLHEMLERREIVNVFLLNESGSMENHVKELVEPIYISQSVS